MEQENQSNVFEFTYSAKQQEEVQKIREKYVQKTEDKMEQLRRLDESVTRKGSTISLIVGVLGTLVLGVGMSCCMVWGGVWFAPGIVLGVIGIAGVALAYPLYDRVTRKEREKIAPEILRLTDELLK